MYIWTPLIRDLRRREIDWQAEPMDIQLTIYVNGFTKPEQTAVNAGQLSLTHWGRDNLAASLQTSFSNAFSWMKTRISTKISLKFVPKAPIDNTSALVQVMTWRQTDDKPLP